MESAADTVPAKRKRTEGHNKTQIPPETMLEVLRWLDRFDLDGKQITSRRLRSLVEINRVPLREVKRVEYSGRYTPLKEPWLQILLNFGDHGRPTAEHTFETDADVQKAAAYLSSCFVRLFRVDYHKKPLPRNAVIAAPPLIHDLEIRSCDFDKGQVDTLSATLTGTWQIDDKGLASLRRRGCNEIWLFNDNVTNYEVTEEGILSYCFTSVDDLPVPGRRYLRIACANLMPVFFKKLVEASKNSRLTCDVRLCLHHLRFDVSNLDVGVLPSRCREAHEHHVRYNIADHGNGVGLLIDFESKNGEEWEAVVRHGKKDCEELFKREDGTEEEEDDDEKEEEDDEGGRRRAGRGERQRGELRARLRTRRFRSRRW
ncbi:hypothetical protein AAVH_25735 [Aphelenchoides avenae]|nr:hypothetical protein AAVH_25735 [Aphelenchus avenae]